MIAVQEFAALVESFGNVNKVVDNIPSPKTSLEAFLVPGATLTPVCVIKRLAASFEALTVDCGMGSASKSVALVVRRDKESLVVLWDLLCRSQCQARSEAEAACREFAVNSEEQA